MWLCVVGSFLAFWQAEIDNNGRLYFHGFPVQEHRLEFPLGDCVDRSRDEQWGALLDFDAPYQSVAPNYAGHGHLTLHLCQSCQFGIGWSNNLDGVRGEEFATKSHPIVDYLLSACRRNNYHATEQGSDVSVSHDD